MFNLALLNINYNMHFKSILSQQIPFPLLGSYKFEQTQTILHPVILQLVYIFLQHRLQKAMIY